MASTRTRKNILITGTPGVGKTTLAERVAALAHLTHINVSEFVKERQLFEEFDADLDTYVIDEDKVLDEMEPLLAQGGVIVDYHGADFFPERWFDYVVVLQTDNTVLYDRLTDRCVRVIPHSSLHTSGPYCGQWTITDSCCIVDDRTEGTPPGRSPKMSSARSCT